MFTTCLNSAAILGKVEVARFPPIFKNEVLCHQTINYRQNIVDKFTKIVKNNLSKIVSL